jgi:glyoxylate carboligase
MLNQAERPLIVCGGGVINADARTCWSSSPSWSACR